MLNNFSKLLTGDILKALCDMGHGDVLILADANFPGESIAKSSSVGKLIRVPGHTVTEILDAIIEFFPLDYEYSGNMAAAVMDLTEGDKAKGATEPEAWADYLKVINKKYKATELGKIERFDFYDKAKKSYVIIETGEERKYGNLYLTKGVVY